MNRLICAAIAWVCLAAVPASAQVPWDKAAIEQALRESGHYAATVLIPETGKGRADYDLIAGEWREYEPHWHTGQTILGLIEAWRITGEPELLAAARRGGDWWVSTEFQPPHPLAGLVDAQHGARVGPLINFTTISDGTAGLFALTQATGDPRYADAAARSGRWLFANTRVLGADGLYFNIIEPETGRIWTDRSPHHPDANPASLTQVARPNIEGSLALDMCRHTGEQAWCDQFIDHAGAVVRWQGPEGLWMAFEPNDPETGKVHPRFNLWNAEALINAYDLSGDRRFLEAALKTGRKMATYQDRHGAIAYTLNVDGSSRPDSITGSATAFAGILWLRLRAHGVGEEFTPHIDRSLTWILANRFSTEHPDPNLRGAILETRVTSGPGGTQIAVRDIATAFGLRFLAMAWREAGAREVSAEQRP